MRSQNQMKKFEEMRILKPLNFALVLEEMKATFYNYALIPCESNKYKDKEMQRRRTNKRERDRFSVLQEEKEKYNE